MEQRVLGGRYLLKDKVGTGGMATVYRAQDQVLNRTVAVKIMLPQYAGDATFAARFKQEAQAAAGLSSPYIVGVYDWGKDGDTYYIVMEYLRGTDLKSGIKSHGALDPKKVAQIGSQISSALSVAHKHEIIHRDIKPQNIMVLPDGNIKVMDFGIARAKNSHLTQDNNVLGTAHYVSPEQTRGQDLGPTSDIYSLGVVMYECATGRVPFDGDDAISVALKQVNELPVPPSQINSGVDADLERIILKCMEKDPANRFQTADELRQVLNSYLSGHTVNISEPTRIIGAPGELGATKTRELSDQTRAMVRPVSGVSGQNTARSSVSGSTGSYEVEKPKSNKNKIIAAVVAAVAVIGIVVAILLSNIDYRSLVNVWPVHVALTWGLVLPTLVIRNVTLGPLTIGYNAGDTDNYSWYKLGGFTFQPTELAKISFILTFAMHLNNVRSRLNEPKELVKLLLHLFVPIGIIHIQGDDGTAIIYGIIGCCMLFAAGLSWKYIIGAFAALAAAAAVVFAFFSDKIGKGYQWYRILAVIDPNNETGWAPSETIWKNIVYQQQRGEIAIGSGGIFGNGFFGGRYYSVPNAHNDFIFSWIGNAAGFVGCCVVLGVLLAIIIKTFATGACSEDMLGSFICAGIGGAFMAQIFVNVGMNLRLLPVIGVTLPFYSAGGSSVLMLYICVGLVLSVYMHNTKKLFG